MTQFQPLRLEDRDIVLPYLQSQRVESSEMTFSTMYIWRKAMQVTYAQLAGCLVFSTKDGNNPASLRFPVGDGDKKEAVLQACEQFRAMGEHPKFYGMTESAAQQLDALFPGKFEFSEMKDYADYVYKSERLISLSGKKLHSKRNHINTFTRMYEYEYSPITSADADMIMQGYDRWFVPENEALKYEYDAISDVLRNFETLELVGGKITVNGVLCAFTVGELLNENTAVVHIEKADVAYKGAYSAINQMFVEREWSDVEYINREEDCGIEGLRKAKQSYYPDRMVRKFKAVLK